MTAFLVSGFTIAVRNTLSNFLLAQGEFKNTSKINVLQSLAGILSIFVGIVLHSKVIIAVSPAVGILALGIYPLIKSLHGMLDTRLPTAVDNLKFVTPPILFLTVKSMIFSTFVVAEPKILFPAILVYITLYAAFCYFWCPELRQFLRPLTQRLQKYKNENG